MSTLEDLLADLRSQRGFDAQRALEQKRARIEAYFAAHDLDTAVVGVSGGIDSALTLALLAHTSRQPQSVIKKVVGALLPVYTPGTTRQDEATSRGRLAIEAASAELWLADLSLATEAMHAALTQHSPYPSTPWAQGQLASYIRAPALYTCAALLQASGHRALVVGTTNRDEGAYLGFFGKASDGMVDLQPISDLHKSEVYALARHLELPKPLINATPSGDVFDGRVDEEMIGAPYWAVELILSLKCSSDAPKLLATLDEDALATYKIYAQAVEQLHRHNAHKYKVGSPAVHLDVYPRAVPGGWS